jgi:hypothetical protein
LKDGAMKSPTIECLESPPERHADRVTADMIRFLIAQRAGTNARVEAELVRSFGKRDGNPKAQEKFVERVRSAGGKTLLSVLLCPGKRGRYSMVIYDWVGFDPERNLTIQESDVPPPKPWLACWTTLFSALDGKRDSATGAFLLVTHHALSRLAQRLGAREPDDLLAAVQVLGRAGIAQMHRDDDGVGMQAWYNQPPDRLPLLGGQAIIKKPGALGAPIVVTVLGPEMS